MPTKPNARKTLANIDGFIHELDLEAEQSGVLITDILEEHPHLETAVALLMEARKLIVKI